MYNNLIKNKKMSEEDDFDFNDNFNQLVNKVEDAKDDAEKSW